MPFKVITPAPDLANEPVPERIPSNAVEVLLLPVVNVPLPKVTLPLPLNEPIASLKLFNANTAPLLIVTLLLFATALLIPTCNVPAVILVAPLYVLTPDKVNTEAPILMILPVPLIIPA